jgi:guanylate kinase
MTQELKHLQEFQTILTDYHISEESKRILKQTELVLLLAPTSTGRYTIIRELSKTDEYYYIVSDTTRPPRVNDGVPEQNGVEYWFRTEEQVLDDLKAGRFVEAEIIHNQQVSGMSIRELKQAHKLQKIAITDIDLQGMYTIVAAKPDTIAVLLLPPNFREWQRRIMHRGVMGKEEYRRRLETACRIFEAALEHAYYTFVINDTVKHAAEQIHTVTTTGKVDLGQQAIGRTLTEKLLIETKQFLSE